MNAHRWVYLLSNGMVLLGQTSPEAPIKAQAIKENETLIQLKRAAELGDPRAMYQLGYMVNDPKEAEDWVRKSADAGYGLAMVVIAGRRHRAVTRDSQLPLEEKKKSASVYRKAVETAFPRVLDSARSGDLDSMCSLENGPYRQFGLLSENEERNWLRRAAEGGHAIAILRLGETLLSDISDTLKAEGFQWLRKAADGGNIHAILEMARRYTHGLPAIGLAPDPDEAMRWINKAITLSGEPEGDFMPTHGLVDPYEAARQRGETPRPRKEKPKAPPPIPTERK